MQSGSALPPPLQAYLLRIRGTNIQFLAFSIPDALVPSFLLEAEYAALPTVVFIPTLPARYTGLTQTDLNELLEYISGEL